MTDRAASCSFSISPSKYPTVWEWYQSFTPENAQYGKLSQEVCHAIELWLKYGHLLDSLDEPSRDAIIRLEEKYNRTLDALGL